MKDRIKTVRAGSHKNQTEFGALMGVSKSAVQKWESGENVPTSAVLSLMAQKFGVSETWLRTGVGEPYEVRTREEEMGDLLGSLMKDSPESFRSRLITALLRFDPDGSEWQVLENIYNSVAAEADENSKETDQ